MGTVEEHGDLHPRHPEEAAMTHRYCDSELLPLPKAGMWVPAQKSDWIAVIPPWENEAAEGLCRGHEAGFSPQG